MSPLTSQTTWTTSSRRKYFRVNDQKLFDVEHTSGTAGAGLLEEMLFLRRSKSSLDTRLTLDCLSPEPVSICGNYFSVNIRKYLRLKQTLTGSIRTYPGLIIWRIPQFIFIVKETIIDSLGHLLGHLHSWCDVSSPIKPGNDRVVIHKVNQVTFTVNHTILWMKRKVSKRTFHRIN